MGPRSLVRVSSFRMTLEIQSTPQIIGLNSPTGMHTLQRMPMMLQKEHTSIHAILMQHTVPVRVISRLDCPTVGRLAPTRAMNHAHCCDLTFPTSPLWMVMLGKWLKHISEMYRISGSSNYDTDVSLSSVHCNWVESTVTWNQCWTNNTWQSPRSLRC